MPVASIAVMLRRRTMTTGGKRSSWSVTSEILSVTPKRKGPWIRKMAT
jgi:hypothetical protein